ncbi:hypothetical protein BCR33DRAFT_722426 [Rhizoclosmatium globosum]|uniref:GH18 domain-containing protein n=1 Tax=Rhizoclosmatium globosum TaxID=329046 RepID=A0A1Y2BP60_9FUNG|nr:hypothetical protein BCR33DRAFT_722426 [Rhizoclosmatium globosum]|eukprot:ORY35945.1 hypothetical protein BCR33DRAFT_722426 [Rhizoclosmatium globosum]
MKLTLIAATLVAVSQAQTACAPPYDSTKTYLKGDVASVNGVNYVGNWWSQNNDPTANSGSWGQWTNQGPCGSGPATTTAAAVKTTTTTIAPVKTTTAAVVQTTTAAQVKTTTTAAPVTTTANVVTTTQASSNVACYPNWTATPFGAGQIPYNTGDLVSYNGQNWVVGYQGAAGPPNAAPGAGWTLQGPCNGSFQHKPYTTPGVIGYWTQWSMYSRRQNAIDKLDLSGFTGINYAFVNALADGSLQTFDSNADLNYMRKFTALRYKYPNLKPIISIGGWSGSRYFSTIAKSAATIQTFVKNVHTFLDTEGFDGVDIDWEYPGGGGLDCNAVDPADVSNFVNLLAVLRAELGPTRTISLAVSAEVSRYVDGNTKVNRIPDILKYVSYIQIMSYDFYGSWNSYSDFNSPLFSPRNGTSDPVEPPANSAGYSQPLSISAAVNAWIAAGAKPSQLTSGLAFYGRSWSVTSNVNNGLYQPCKAADGNTGCGVIGDYLDAAKWKDPCGGEYNSGVWMYNNLRGAANTNGQQAAAPLASGATAGSNGWTRQYFDFAQNPTVYSPSYLNRPTIVSYDDPVSIKAKAQWSKNAGLGGVMIWELSQDYNLELITATKAGWGI